MTPAACQISRSSILALALSAAFTAHAYAADPIAPDPKLTPGAVLTTDLGKVCRPGYTKTVRHTSGKLKALVYREYGIKAGGGRYEIDHLIPLCLGGADVRENLWPESRDTQPWNAGKKDQLEAALCRTVCAGSAPIEQAQHEIATDWIAAYRKYVGER